MRVQVIFFSGISSIIWIFVTGQYSMIQHISCALLNTEKGKAFFRDAAEGLILEERPVSEAVAGNDQLRAPSKPHPSRDLFEDAYRRFGFSGAMKKTGMAKRVKLLRAKNVLLWVPRRIKRAIRNARQKSEL